MAENSLSIAWEGLKQFTEALDKISEQSDEAAKTIVSRSAAVVENAVKQHFSGAHKKGEPHVGGDQPNVVTGTLRRSIRADPVTQQGSGVYGTRIGPRTVYARRVELGYRGSRGYPYVTPGYADAAPLIKAIQLEEARKFLTAR